MRATGIVHAIIAKRNRIGDVLNALLEKKDKGL
jgi:hypothetical protein